MHIVPAEWIAAAGLIGFKPTYSSFRCNEPHVLMRLADIEPPLRNEGVTLDANGFRRDRMMKILEGVRDGASIPPIFVEEADPEQRPYRVRDGVHRYWASFALGFLCVPADILDRL